MKKTNLTIIGFSEATLSMILDCLYSLDSEFNLTILNNLNLTPKFDYEHPNFEIKLVTHLDENQFDNCVIGLTNPIHKIKLVEVLNLYNKNMISLIHKNTSISLTTKINTGCLINPNVTIAAHTNIDKFVTINRNSSIGHHTFIGEYVTINPGVNIAGHVHIGERTSIGMGSNILNNVNIGKNCIIGAGSLVNRDIPDNSVAWGHPCKVIKENIK